MPYNGSGVFVLISGNPVVTGTTISSTWANNTLADLSANGLSNAITKDGQTTPTANIGFGGFRLTSVGSAVARTDATNAGQIQDGSLVLLASVAGADTITAVSAPTITAYVAGQVFQFLPAASNATSTPTLNISGVGAKNITKNGAAALGIGDLAAGTAATVFYDGTQFQLLGAGYASGAPGGSYFSYRNKLINALGQVNQRNYVSGTATTGANQYTLDRWRVVVSGQNLTFSGSTFTAPAGGVEQVVESVNNEGGVFALSWTGTATAQINGAAVTNGSSVTVTAGTTITVRFSAGTFQKPQLEARGVTPFEYPLIQRTLADCMRYYENSNGNMSFTQPGSSGTANQRLSMLYTVPKRVGPTLTVTVGAGSAAFLSGNERFAIWGFGGTTMQENQWSWTATAEL